MRDDDVVVFVVCGLWFVGVWCLFVCASCCRCCCRRMKLFLYR